MRKFIPILLLILIISTSCSLPGLGATVQSDGIVVAGGSTTERQILSEVLVQMADHYIPNADNGVINNLGSTYLMLQTINMDDANILSVGYTGTSLMGELGQAAITNPDEAREQVVRGYYKQLDMVWFPSYGFENTYAFMVTEDFATEHGITKVSELAELQDSIRVGIDTGWLDRAGDGYEAFKKKYGFEFEHIAPMEIGLVYDALKNKNMDVVLGYSTDGRIQANNLVLLEDDLHLFPPYDASTAVTLKILDTYPELETVILKLEGEIDNSTMQELNRQCDQDKIEPQIVAKRFLKEKNYFEDKKVIPLKERALYRELLGNKRKNDYYDE